MAATDNSKIILTKVAPPNPDAQFETKDKLSLVLEVGWFIVLLFVHIPLCIYRTIFPPEEKPIKGKVVLVTGAGRGLGRGLALGFFKEGCKVAVADINYENALQTASEISASGGTTKAYYCNVAKVEDVKALQEAVARDLGPVDILVNNAGVVYGGMNIEESTDEDIRTVVEVNLLSHYWMMRAFLPSMRARNSGHIVAIASMGSFIGGAGGSAYIPSKFGVRGLMEVVRDELEARANNNIKTTTVCPYFINTSADYIKSWEMRLPPTSIEQVVEATIAGVKRNQVSVLIPAIYEPLIHIFRLIPLSLQDRIRRILSVKVTPLNYDKISINNGSTTNGSNTISNGWNKQSKNN